MVDVSRAPLYAVKPNTNFLRKQNNYKTNAWIAEIYLLPKHLQRSNVLFVFTVRLHVMQRTILLSEFCLSVCPSVRRVYCDKTKWYTADILIPHETAITLVFWHQQWLVGDAPFSLKSALKVTHPFEKRRLRPISAHNVSTVGDSGKR